MQPYELKASALPVDAEGKDRPPVSVPELEPPFAVLGPVGASPLVFSSPHSGSVYPAAFIAAAQLDSLTLRRSEDAFVDELFVGALEVGACLFKAHFPRAYLDVNREPYELDPRMFEGRLPAFANTRSMRVAGGLGTIARVVGEAQEIYARRLPVEEALNRIETLYKPFHRQLRRLMRASWEAFGATVLIDCHSMPSSLGKGLRLEDRIKADIVLGDRYGTSCHPAIVDLVQRELSRLGYSVQRNKPYAGGFITEHYGNPAAGWHALQIELNRGLYLEEHSLQRSPGFAALQRDLTHVAHLLGDLVATFGNDRAAAAE
jgi:N-formylglutamate amidohydrolase